MAPSANGGSPGMGRPFHSLSSHFRAFAETECRGSSPLYEALALALADDEPLSALAARSRPGQPVPNLFFGAIHYLLLLGNRHPLAGFYGSCVPAPRPAREAFPCFRDFVMANSSAITRLLAERLVQTNEVRRSAYLRPALCHAARFFPGRPLALVEIGASAGLNLLWDQYCCRYASGETAGNPGSPVQITSSFRGPARPDLAAPVPAISHRIGLDLHPVDAGDPDDALWLRSLVWPENAERRALLECALAFRASFPIDLRGSDGFAALPGVAREIPPGPVLTVYHTHTANQITAEARAGFLATIEALGRRRDLIHLCNNIRPGLHLTVFREGSRVCDERIAEVDGHARWIEWCAA